VDYAVAAALLMRPHLLGVFATVVTGQGQLLAAFPVDPCLYPSGTGTTYLAPLQLAGLSFYYWRGSMKFHFTFAVTPFATGKVRIVWTPNQITSYPDTGVVFSHIVDIVGETHYTFSVPFRGAMWNRAIPGNQNGFITVWAETNVAAPNTSTVLRLPLAVWQAAGADFMYARPFITAPASTAKAHGVGNMQELFTGKGEFFVQSALSVPRGIRDDLFTNWRSYMHRFVFVNRVYISAGASATYNTSAWLALPPSWYAPLACYRGLISSFIFRFVVRFGDGSFVWITANPPTEDWNGYGDSGIIPCYSDSTVGVSEEKVVTIHVPFDSALRYYTSDQWDSTDTCAFSSSMPTVSIYNSGTTEAAGIDIYASFGDDTVFTIPTAGVDSTSDFKLRKLRIPTSRVVTNK